MDTHKSAVIHFYDTHPINEDEIIAKLAARGDDLENLTEDQLKDFDQDHYGGIDVVDTLALRAGLRREHRLLDVCSGMGGPARWLRIAWAVASPAWISPSRASRRRAA